MEDRKITTIIYDRLNEDFIPKGGKEARRKSVEVVGTLEKCLNDEEKKHLDQLLDLWMEMECESNESKFNLGFRAGFQLALEVLDRGN